MKSLRILCESEEITSELKNILFGNPEEEEEEGLIPILTELLQRKNLQTELTLLLIAMNEIRGDRELLNQEQRQELYFNVFSGNKKIVKETEKLMKSLQADFWMETMKSLSNFYSDTIDLKKFVEIVRSIDEIKFDLEDIGNLVTDNLEFPKISRAAATIFVEFVKNDKSLIVSALTLMQSILPLCLVDEDTFTIVLEIFHCADSDIFATFYCSHHVEAVTSFNCLVNGFEDFVSPLTVYNIVSVMAKICSLSSQYFIQEIREIFRKLLLKTSAFFYDHKTKNPSDFINSFTKLAVIVENDSWNLLGQDNMDTIFFLAFSYCEDTESLLFPIISRYLCNVLRHFVVRLALDAPVPFKDYDDARVKIVNFSKNLFLMLHNKKSLENFHLIIASLLDILLIFQQGMQTKHNFYRIVNLKISKDEFQAIAVSVEEFLANKNKATKYQREIVIKTFVKFVCNYERLPSRVAPWHVIRFYSTNYEFKDQIEILMNHAMNDKVFDQIVAVVILNFANLEEIRKFRAFFQGIKKFLTSFFKENSAKQIAKISNIATMILSKLPNHVTTLEDGNYVDRLCSLDLILLMISDPVMRKKLHDLIPVKLAEAKLNKAEQKSLEMFKKKLLEEETAKNCQQVSLECSQ